jgi:hypothetical protein
MRRSRKVLAGEPSTTSRRRTACAHVIWRVSERDAAGARGGVRVRAGAVHRRWASSRGQRGARASAAGAGGPGRARALPGGRVSRQPDADPPLQPRGEGPAGQTPEAFRAVLAERFTLTPGGPATPAGRATWRCTWRGSGTTVALGEPRAGLAPDAVLDVSRLQDGVLAPLLGIADVRTDKRIDFVGGIRGTRELERLWTGKWAVAFSMARCRRRPDAHLGRRRHHAPEVHLVRAEAARRAALAPRLAIRYSQFALRRSATNSEPKSEGREPFREPS